MGFPQHSSPSGTESGMERSEQLSSTKVSFSVSGRNDKHSPILLCIGTPGDAAHDGLPSEALNQEFRVISLTSPLPSMDRVTEHASAVEAELKQLGVKRATLLGAGAGASVAQALAVFHPTVVRRLILVDPTARLSPSLGMRIIDRIEHFLPFGLPLRKLNNAFDSRPFLHRLRCPTLILITPQAGLFHRQQSNYLAAKIPNARLRELTNSAVLPANRQWSEALSAEIKSWSETPAKRSQKPLNNEE